MAGNVFDVVIKQLQAFTSPRVQTILAQRCGASAVKFVADRIQRSIDVNGKAFAPLVLRAGKPLAKTGEMKASVNAQPSNGFFALVVPKIQAKLLNFGGTVVPKTAKALAFRGPRGMIFAKKVTIPERKFIPDEKTGIPPELAEAFAEDYADTWREVFGD